MNEETVERRPKTESSERIGGTRNGNNTEAAATRGGENQEPVVSQRPGAPDVSRQNERDQVCPIQLAGNMRGQLVRAPRPCSQLSPQNL